ncbi:hypothetical protein NQ318_018160 [Aromia moschata]|uniref:Beta-hexosaminidase n=1 Tax=Aromia moschata TaxID=1265417 RepID=A0AAV8ZFM3_9CUCU|nr:hypothetical protein NQ318_018160 [Aromia moschata]
MERDSNRSSLKMRAITCIFVAALVISFVYSVDLSVIVKDTVEYISQDDNNQDENVLWTYVCNSGTTCTREKLPEGQERTTLETCNMICSNLHIWPQPVDLQLSKKNSSTFHKHQVTVQVDAADEVQQDLKNATDIFMSNLRDVEEHWITDADVTFLKINIKVAGNDRKIKMSTNEEYNISVTNEDNNVFVNISSPTYFGARHALETLGQLIWFDTQVQKLRIVHDVQIYDAPKFSHRGVMIDTARNFFPIKKLKKAVDGMAATKLNVLHLHLTDAVSFPVVLPNNPIFAQYGAYSSEMVYTVEDIKGLIEYARIRGIRVVLEIDAPSHANEGWNQRAENLVICGQDDVFNGHLNPENNETLNILESVYRDLLELGTYDEMFHIGGDEVNLTCWMEVLPTMRKYSLDMHAYWANFTNKIFDTVKSANENQLPKYVVLWSSPLTDNYISQLNYKDNVVVQYWYGSVDDILSSGHKVIFSTVGRWYLDCGFGPWKPSMTNGVCDPYTPWQTFYKYRPWEEFASYADQFLGGEACLWTEQVEVDSLETRLWPRAAAFAERLWSDPEYFDSQDAHTRLDVHNRRLRKRGIQTAAMWPRWCSQNPGRC